MLYLSSIVIYSVKLETMSDLLIFAITGSLFVIAGLSVLSIVLMFFKLINKQETNKSKKIDKETSEKVIYQKINKIKNLDEDMITAIVTALAIEGLLYYENNLFDLTFEHNNRNIQGWRLSGYINNRR
ncbi:OadG family protein [candidate division WOR-3 bacterium]|nr:OadG family protein [candidate division WOR-3 bacterium]